MRHRQLNMYYAVEEKLCEYSAVLRMCDRENIQRYCTCVTVITQRYCACVTV